MPDTHRVILTKDALADLESIASYVRQDSPQNAISIALMLVDAIDSLGFMPARFKRIGTSRKRGEPVHAIVVRPYILYYRVDDSPLTMHVLHIIHGRRQQPRQFP